MCGIAGIAGSDLPPNETRTLLEGMNAEQRHRGPDGEGVFLDTRAGLACVRLAIVDPAHGGQPLFDEDRQVVAVCNGEIYNAPELRAELEGRGHRFRSHSDCEVLVHLFEEHGADLLGRLRGMFGLAIWDRRRETLLLARDPFGIKPLHFARLGDGAGSLLFASEAKAILGTGKLPRALDVETFGHVAHFGAPLPPRTLFRGVSTLAPGQRLLWRRGSVELASYWHPRYPGSPGVTWDRRPTRELVEEMRWRFDESVRVHLQSDVPISAMLSGGIDSSSVLVSAAEQTAERLTAFSLTFDEKSLDEFTDQQTLQDSTAWEGVRVRCGYEHLAEFPRAVWHQERFALIGLARMVLTREIRERGFKVVLSGEGGDETLGGYRWYHGQRWVGPLGVLPAPVRRLAARAVRPLRPGLARLLVAPSRMDMHRTAVLLGRSLAERFARVLRPEYAGPCAEPPALWPAPPADFERWHPFCQLQFMDQRTRMTGIVVHGLETACMAHSVEARVPFLDVELTAFLDRLPLGVKLHGLREKHILREAMRGRMPEAVRRRPKRGLAAPHAAWMAQPLPEPLERQLSRSALEETGYFRPPEVQRLLQRRRSPEAMWLLWPVLGIQLAHRLFVERVPWWSLVDGGGRERRFEAAAG